MSRKYWSLSIPVILLAASMALLAFTLHGQRIAAASAPLAPPDAPEQQVVAGSYYWNYSAKFVCGLQVPTQVGEPVVKPGNYATVINIHNYTYGQVEVRKKVIVLNEGDQAIREPQSAPPRGFDKITLGPDYATMDDCNRLWVLTHPTGGIPSPMPLFEGYLVLISRVDLDVDAVYTAAQYANPTPSPDIDVERVPGKRVFIPPGALP
jgi:hypothetical protein